MSEETKAPEKVETDKKAPDYYALPNDVVVALVKYLRTKPYEEAEPFITAINKTAQPLNVQKQDSPSIATNEKNIEDGNS
jgi:hypothetical protein